MLASRQASISRVPAGAVSFLPSTVKVTSAMDSYLCRSCAAKCRFRLVRVGTGFAVQVVFKLLAKLVNEGDGGHGGCVAQGAEGAAQHVLRQITNIVDIFGHAAARVEASERLLQPVGAFAAGNTPATALVLVELHGSQGKLHHADSVVQNHNAARTEHAAGLGYLIEVHADIDFIGPKYRTGGSSGYYSFQRAAIGDAATHLVDHLLEVVTHGQFVD